MSPPAWPELVVLRSEIAILLTLLDLENGSHRRCLGLTLNSEGWIPAVIVNGACHAVCRLFSLKACSEPRPEESV